MVYIRYGGIDYVVAGAPSVLQVREEISRRLRLEGEYWLDVEYPDGPNVRHNKDMVVMIMPGTPVALYER